MAPRNGLRRQDDGERLARLEERSGATFDAIIDVKQILQDHIKAQGEENKAISTRVSALEKEQSASAAKIIGVAAGAAGAGGFTAWLLNFIRGH